MNIIPSNCFSGILYAAMESNGVGPKQLEGILQDQGVTDITFKRISEYAHGQHTPPFERAQSLLAALEFPIEPEELKESLRLNRKLIQEENGYIASDNKEVRRTIRFRLQSLLPNCTAEETERYLWDRIEGLCGGKRLLSLYVKKLIAKDLQEYIISREEISENED